MRIMQTEERKDRVNEAAARSKRPYTPPKLVEYGSITKLTSGAQTAVSEGGGTFRSAG